MHARDSFQFSVIVLVGVFAAAAAHAQVSPFVAVKWQGAEPPLVRVAGDPTWYVLQRIDNAPASEIVAYCRAQHGGEAEKRFTEDLVEMVLTPMGHTPGAAVTLVLRPVGGGESVTREGVLLTKANRQALWAANRAAEPARAERSRGDSPPALTPDDAMADLAQLHEIMRTRWSYYRAGGAEFEQVFAEAREAAREVRSPEALARVIRRVLACGIDGHARIRNSTRGGPYLPFLLEPLGERFVGFRPDRTAFAAEGYPYVAAIDGTPIADWIAAAEREVPRGSKPYRTWQSLRALRALDYWRRELKLPLRETVSVTLANDAGATRTVELPVARRKPIYGKWPRPGDGPEVRRLERNVGYIRVAGMEPAWEARMHAAMQTLRDTDGLIVDVRDNTGGTRDALRAFFPYTMRADEPPQVVNVAAYRLHPAYDENHLASRFAYRAGSANWSAAEQRAIVAFAAKFTAEWAPPVEAFSAWHYMVVSRPAHGGVYHYDKPIVVLLNHKCFSATDIFLGALKGRPGVTLMGTASAGGSARADRHRLARSGLELQLGTMVSYRRDGRLYDGNGIRPDLLLKPVPTDFLANGGDRMLERAVAELARDTEQAQPGVGDAEQVQPGVGDAEQVQPGAGGADQAQPGAGIK